MEVRTVARYANEITPGDVGGRVSLRHRIAGNHTSGPSLTDVVGTLRRWSDGVLVVQRRDGSTAEVPEEAVVASRRLPPAQARRPGRAAAG